MEGLSALHHSSHRTRIWLGQQWSVGREWDSEEQLSSSSASSLPEHWLLVPPQFKGTAEKLVPFQIYSLGGVNVYNPAIIASLFNSLKEAEFFLAETLVWVQHGNIRGTVPPLGRGETDGGRGGLSSAPPPLPAKNTLVLEQRELHNLVLVHHVDRDVPRLSLRSQQRGSKNDGQALSGHTIGFPVFSHPGEVKTNESHAQKRSCRVFTHESLLRGYSITLTFWGDDKNKNNVVDNQWQQAIVYANYIIIFSSLCSHNFWSVHLIDINDMALHLIADNVSFHACSLTKDCVCSWGGTKRS